MPFSDHSFDVAISMQLLEHLHPDDVHTHFSEVYRVLKPKGKYIVETPNKYVGPGDVSRFFSEVPEGFHLGEYSIYDLCKIVHQNKFHHSEVLLWKKKRLSEKRALLLERLWSFLPKSIRRKHTIGLHNPILIAYKVL